MKEKLTKELEAIGYRVNTRTMNEWIINHKKENTGWRMRSDGIEHSESNMFIGFKEAKIHKFEDDPTVGFGTDSIFTQFYNWDLKNE